MSKHKLIDFVVTFMEVPKLPFELERPFSVNSILLWVSEQNPVSCCLIQFSSIGPSETPGHVFCCGLVEKAW
jgi:hypothetical protein